MRQPFVFKQFRIDQSRASMPVTTDACIFGVLCHFDNVKNILDIGSGTGLLSLMQAQLQSNAQITAVEPDLLSFEDCCQNFQNSPWKNRLTAYNVPIQDFKSPYPFDGIICNPPFFENQLPSVSEHKRKARHTDTLNYKSLLNAINLLLSSQGTAYLLVPKIHTTIVLQNILELGLYVNQTITIQSNPGKKSHLSIFKINRGSSKQLYLNFITYCDIMKLSDQAISILKPFYLHL